MKGLILNDFLSMRKLLKSILFVFFAFAAIWGFMGQPETGAIIICVMGISYLFNLFTYDEYYHWDQYRSILPVTHKQIVLARYAAFGITSLILLGISSSYTLILGGAARCGLMLLVSLCMQGYTTAVIIPIAYKFGMQKGRMLYLLTMLIPFGIMMGLTIALSEAGMIPTGGMLALMLVALIVLIVLMVMVSIHISIKIVSKKSF